MASLLTPEERFYDCFSQLVVEICSNVIKVVPEAMEPCVNLEFVGMTVKPVPDSVASMRSLEVALLDKLAKYKTDKECRVALSQELLPAVVELNGVYDAVFREYDSFKEKYDVVVEKVEVIRKLLSSNKSDVAVGLLARIAGLKWPKFEEFDLLKNEVCLQKARLNDVSEESVGYWKKSVVDRVDKENKRRKRLVQMLEEHFGSPPSQL